MQKFVDLVERANGISEIARIISSDEIEILAWCEGREEIPARYHVKLWKLAVLTGSGWVPPDCDGYLLTSVFSCSLDAPVEDFVDFSKNELSMSFDRTKLVTTVE